MFVVSLVGSIYHVSLSQYKNELEKSCDARYRGSVLSEDWEELTPNITILFDNSCDICQLQSKSAVLLYTLTQPLIGIYNLPHSTTYSAAATVMLCQGCIWLTYTSARVLG